MKKLLLIIFVATCSSAHCQNPYQIVDSTKTWNTLEIGVWAFMVVHCGGTTTYKFQGEIVIGDYSYLNVYENIDSTSAYWNHIGFIREDTIAQQIFFRNSFAEEGLIYDFSIDIGDTINFQNYYNYGSEDYDLYCYNIDQIYINGELKNRYHLSNIPYGYPVDIWTEGIGSSQGILNSGVLEPPGGDSKLLCCSQNGEVLYQNPLFDNCYITEFYPKFITTNLDTAYLNTYYEFQLEISDTSGIDSISYNAEYFSGGFSLDPSTGIISGTPTSTGSFPIGISVRNHNLMYKTDIIETELVVVEANRAPAIEPFNSITLQPNPCREQIFINIKEKPSNKYILEVMDFTGKTIDIRDILASTTYNTSSLSKGIYLFKFTGMNNMTPFVKKVVIE